VAAEGEPPVSELGSDLGDERAEPFALRARPRCAEQDVQLLFPGFVDLIGDATGALHADGAWQRAKETDGVGDECLSEPPDRNPAPPQGLPGHLMSVQPNSDNQG
jgi:hypothetical protein